INGPDDAMWFGEQSGAQIGRIGGLGAGVPSFSSYNLTGSGAGVGAGAANGVAVGSDGNIWYSESAAGQRCRGALVSYTLTDAWGEVTSFGAAPGAEDGYVPTKLSRPGGANQLTVLYTNQQYAYDTEAVPSYAIAAAPGTVPQSCISSPSPGCRVLQFQ